MAEAFDFEAEIIAGKGGGAFVEFPGSVRETFGTGGRVAVAVTFDGHAYRGSLVPMGGGTHVLGLRKEIREAIGKGVGGRVAVHLERDTQPRTVTPPPELAAVLAAAPDARASFEALAYTHQREYAEWIGQAKKQDTKERRAGRAVEMLREGKTR